MAASNRCLAVEAYQMDSQDKVSRRKSEAWRCMVPPSHLSNFNPLLMRVDPVCIEGFF